MYGTGKYSLQRRPNTLTMLYTTLITLPQLGLGLYRLLLIMPLLRLCLSLLL